LPQECFHRLADFEQSDPRGAENHSIFQAATK
jgi:hypothetical protein